MFHIYTTQKDKPFNVSNGRARFYINGGRDVSALGEESGKCIEVDTYYFEVVCRDYSFAQTSKELK